MLASARMAFPGVLMTIMLAGAAHAAPVSDTGTGPESATSEKPGMRSVQGRNKTPRLARGSRAKLADLAYDDPRAVAARDGAEDAAPRKAAAAKTAFRGDAQGNRGDAVEWHQEGMASWYGGRRWQGHRTSSGETYDEASLTAAHATLPIGTRVRVTAADGSRSVVVVINDRPGTRTRIIDLSRSAASELGMLSSGVARVSLSKL